MINLVCPKAGIKHKLSSTYHPQTNSLVERINRTICEALAKCVNQYEGDWDDYLYPVLFACRTLKHSSTKFSPFYLTYGREATLPVEMLVETYPIEDFGEDQFQSIVVARTLKLTHDLFEARIKARENIRKTQLYQKWHHDQQHPLQTYEVGEKVLKYNAKLAAKIGGKLEEKWSGPFRICEALGNGTYKLQTIGFPEKVQDKVVHGSQLKRYIEREDK